MNNKNFYIESLGCLANQVDTERVKKFFRLNGWGETKNIQAANIIVLMTCGFTKVSEDYNIKRLIELKSVKSDNSQIIVGGCLPSINKEKIKDIFNGVVFSPRTLGRLDSVIDASQSIENVSPVKPDENISSAKVIRISTGCMSNCSFCAIPFANGRTKSRTITQILNDCSTAIDEGYSDIKFVSEDVGAYGLDIGITVVDLVRAYLKSGIGANLYMDYFHPNWFYRYKNELLEVFAFDNIIKNICIPVQSGSDRILSLMKREYTISQTDEILGDLNKTYPDIKISTDFIVGFPSETEEDFSMTIDFLHKHTFSHIQIFTYEGRPRIQAEQIDPKVPDDVKEERRMRLFKEYVKHLINRNGVNNVDELTQWLGTQNNLPVNFNLVLQ